MNSMKAMKAISIPEFIRKAVNDVLNRLYNQIGEVNLETGKPILNSKTQAKLAILRPFMNDVNAGKPVDIETQKNVLQRCLHVSTAMTAKLEGINALSTASSVNPVCLARSKDCNSICSHCFAFLTFKQYNDLEQAAIINFIVLNSMIFDFDAWKAVPIPTSNGMFRIEAFGDTASAVQAANYITLAFSHPYLTDIGIWSKNLGFWSIAFSTLGKPGNVVFNASSPVMNMPIAIKPEYMWFIDHIFTVYDAAHAIEENVDINCGERICRNCKRCYTKGNDKAVNEILKQESKRYYKAIGKTFTGRK